LFTGHWTQNPLLQPLPSIPTESSMSIHTNTVLHARVVFEDEILYEGTGLYGSSTLAEVELETGKVTAAPCSCRCILWRRHHNLWQQDYPANVAGTKRFVYDKAIFALQEEFSYSSEGWGITDDRRETDHERRLSHPELSRSNHLELIGQIQVHDGNDQSADSMNSNSSRVIFTPTLARRQNCSNRYRIRTS